MTEYDRLMESAEDKRGLQRNDANSRMIDNALASGNLVMVVMDSAYPLTSKRYFTPDKAPKGSKPHTPTDYVRAGFISLK